MNITSVTNNPNKIDFQSQIEKHEKIVKMARLTQNIGLGIIIASAIATVLFFTAPVTLPVLAALGIAGAIALVGMIRLPAILLSPKTAAGFATVLPLPSQFFQTTWNGMKNFAYNPAVASVAGLAGGAASLVGLGLIAGGKYLENRSTIQLKILREEQFKALSASA